MEAQKVLSRLLLVFVVPVVAIGAAITWIAAKIITLALHPAT